MDDFNAPEPSMGADPMMGDQDMGMGNGMDDGMNDDMNDDMGNGMDDGMGQDMGMDEPMGDSPEMGTSEDDQELLDVLDKMSVEDKAAVIKYAKSMVDDDNDDFGEPEEPGMGEEDPNMGNDGMMPESRMPFRRAIDETFDSFGNNGINRKEKKMPKKYRKLMKGDPFKSQYKTINTNKKRKEKN